MSAYSRYWLFTALLVSLLLFGWNQGFFTWLSVKFSDPRIVYSAIFLTVIFLWAYFIVGHGVASSLYIDDKILLKFLEKPFGSDMTGDEKVIMVQSLLSKFKSEYSSKQFRKSKVTDAMKSLTERIKTMKQVDTFETINRSLFQAEFEEDLARGLAILEKYRLGLFFVGFLGTVVGIVLALASQSVPTNVEQTRDFTFNILSGAGLAYTTSALGIGGGLVLYVLHSLLENSADKIAIRFKTSMFETIFPVIHSDSYLNTTEDREAANEAQ